LSTERLIASHLRLARESLNGAKSLLVQGNRYGAYLAEQAVEHLILAVAQAEGVHFARSQQHQLELMRRALPPEGRYRETLARLTWLEEFGTTYRYPRTAGGMTDPPEPEKLGPALADAEELIIQVASHFEVDLDPRSKKPASHARPPRTK
jgi:HEPN domain-containing protein